MDALLFAVIRSEVYCSSWRVCSESEILEAEEATVDESNCFSALIYYSNESFNIVYILSSPPTSISPLI